MFTGIGSRQIKLVSVGIKIEFLSPKQIWDGSYPFLNFFGVVPSSAGWLVLFQCGFFWFRSRWCGSPPHKKPEFRVKLNRYV